MTPMWGRGQKYRNVRTTKDGYAFDSLKESRRYDVLCLMEKAGAITNLVADKKRLRFRCVVNGQLVCTYVGDFGYDEQGTYVLEDVKSVATRTPLYRLKKKLVKAIHGIEIREV